MNATVGIALTALLVSVISPIISNIINIRHEDKVNKRKYEFEVLTIKYDNYLKAAGAMTNNPNYDELQTYKQAYGALLPFILYNTQDEFVEFNKYVIAEDFETANDLFPQLCNTIAQLYPKYK